MKKRGQVTVFIILGILILITFAIYFSLKSNLEKGQLEQYTAAELEMELKVKNVKSLVDQCIKKIGGKAILNLGFYGGKEKIVSPYLDQEIFAVNYIYHLGKKKASSIEEIEISLNSMMEEHLNDCVQDFKAVNDYQESSNEELVFHSLIIEKGNLKTTSEVKDEEVIFNVIWPLTIKHKDQVREISKFPEQRFIVNLKKMNLFTEDFVDRLYLEPLIIDAFYLLKQNYSIDLTIFNNDTYVLLVTDNSSLIDDQPLRYLMAAKIDMEGVLT